MTYCNILVFSDFKTATVYKHEGTNKPDWWNKLETLLQWRRSIIPAGCLRSTLFLLGSFVQQSISVKRPVKSLSACQCENAALTSPVDKADCILLAQNTQNSFHPNTNTQPWPLWESQGPHSRGNQLLKPTEKWKTYSCGGALCWKTETCWRLFFLTGLNRTDLDEITLLMLYPWPPKKQKHCIDWKDFYHCKYLCKDPMNWH